MFPTNSKWRWLGPILFGLVNYIIIRLLTDSVSGEPPWQRLPSSNAGEIIGVAISSLIIAQVLQWAYSRYRTPDTTEISMRAIYREFAVIYFFSAVAVNTTLLPVVAFTDNGVQGADIIMLNIVPPITILLYYAVFRGQHFLEMAAAQRVRAEELQREHLETELRFLRAQIQPHFLFNALNTIYFQMDESVEKARETLDRFSALLRYHLPEKSKPARTLAEEAAYLADFIDIQRLRTDNTLNCEINLQPMEADIQIKPLLLLPLVENAFKHAGPTGQISVSAELNSRILDFVVTNSFDPSTQETQTGIGLANLRRRLELLYPHRHQLTIKKANGIFRATLQIELYDN